MDLSVLSVGAKLMPMLIKSKSFLDSLNEQQTSTVKDLVSEIRQQYGDKLPQGFDQLLDYWTTGEDGLMAKLVTTAAHPAVRPLLTSKLVTKLPQAATTLREIQEQITALGGLPATCPSCGEIIVIGAPQLD